MLTRRRLSLADAYNQMLDEAGGLEGLDALVMMHQDTELRDPAFTAKVRARLADPEVAMVGALGVRVVRGGAMWMPDHVGYGRITEELFGLERVLATGNTAGTHEVDALDGFLFVLSPWAVRSLRFDPAFDEVFTATTWTSASRRGLTDRSRPPFTRHTAVAMITSAGYRVGAGKPIEWDLGSVLAYCKPDLLSTKLLRLIVSEPDPARWST